MTMALHPLICLCWPKHNTKKWDDILAHLLNSADTPRIPRRWHSIVPSSEGLEVWIYLPHTIYIVMIRYNSGQGERQSTHPGFRRYAWITIITSTGSRLSSTTWLRVTFCMALHHRSNLRKKYKRTTTTTSVSSSPFYCQSNKPSPTTFGLQLQCPCREPIIFPCLDDRS
jgi:hypothetical protein